MEVLKEKSYNDYILHNNMLYKYKDGQEYWWYRETCKMKWSRWLIVKVISRSSAQRKLLAGVLYIKAHDENWKYKRIAYLVC